MSTPVRFSRIMGALKSSAAYKKSDTPNPLEFNAPLTNSLVPLTGQDYTYSRASTATFIDNEGVLQTAGIGEARFTGSERVTGLPSIPYPYYGANVDGVKYFDSANSKGILLEGESTNYFLNSDTPITQSAMVNGGTIPSTITVTEDTSILVDGASVSSVAPYTYTPAGATSNIQVLIAGTGTVQFEALPHASSYIPTEAATVTRLADVLSYDYTINGLLGSMSLQLTDAQTKTTSYPLSYSATCRLIYGTGTKLYTYDGSLTIAYNTAGLPTPETASLGLSWGPSVATTYNTGTRELEKDLDADGFNPQTNSLKVGGVSAGAIMKGNYSSLRFYNTALPQTQMELLTND